MQSAFIIVAVVVAALLLMTTAVALWEKRMVWPYSEPESQPRFVDSTSYTSSAIASAEALSFRFLGWMHDLKGDNYRLSYAALVSPDRDALVIVGVGTILGMRLQGMWIHTPASDGRSFYTTDHQNCVEIDVSGAWRCQLVPRARFPELWQKHREWVGAHRVTPRGFRPNCELSDFRAVRGEHYEALARQGFISFTDFGHTHWRYTFIGALKFAVLNQSIGLLRAVSCGRLPKTG